MQSNRDLPGPQCYFEYPKSQLHGYPDALQHACLPYALRTISLALYTAGRAVWQAWLRRQPIMWPELGLITGQRKEISTSD